MANWNDVLVYVKESLTLSSGFLEKNDAELKRWIILKSIPEFSKYYPDEEYTAVLVDNENYKVDVRKGYYRFFDEENLPIIGVKNCYMPIGNDMMSGHPISGPFNFEGMKFWALDVFKSSLFSQFTDWSYSFEYIRPNTVRVLPSAPDLEET